MQKACILRECLSPVYVGVYCKMHYDRLKHGQPLRAAKKGSPEAFWAKVAKTNDARGCWLWLGPRHPAGYGRWNSEPAHRASYRLTRGMIPEGKMICHTCDNPPCVRPNHLFAGTAADNTMDAMLKGRLKRG